MRHVGAIWILVFLGLSVLLSAQTGNPFELEHKISNEEKWKKVEVVDLPGTEEEVQEKEQGQLQEEAPKRSIYDLNEIQGNPFDIGGHNVNEALPAEQFKTDPLPVKPAKRVVKNSSTIDKINRFKLILTIILLIALALISTLLRHVITKVFEGFKSDNLLRTYFRTSGRRVSPPNMLLELFFVINAGFTVFLLLEHYDLIGNQPFFQFLAVLLVIIVIVYGKHLVLFIIKEVFPIQKEVSEYNFTINVFLSILGLILMPSNLILAFAPETMATFMVYFVVVSTTLVLGYLAFRSLLIGSKYLGSNRFHFFMYLCTVEIAPLFILFKVVKNYMGS